jgi:hypothetical protein
LQQQQEQQSSIKTEVRERKVFYGCDRRSFFKQCKPDFAKECLTYKKSLLKLEWTCGKGRAQIS